MRYVSLSIFFGLCLSSYVLAAESIDPQTVYWESAHLRATKLRIQEPDQGLQEALSNLRANAARALRQGPFSVTQKKELPPSGDKHDYLSYSRYWWPNPDTADGLPYIRRDGVTNVDMRARGDRDQIGQLFDCVESLALAYYFFEDEKYASQATRLIRTWLLDPATKMNPHLRYGQAVLGRSEGRGVGILDTRGFITLLDCVALLSDSPSFGPADQQGLQQWFAEYLDWLRTSRLGQEESRARNNHGSWYAAQASRIALYVGAEQVVKEIVERVRTERIPSQFLADGSQPFENERTKSLHYCFFNLSALAIVARVGERLGIDVWSSQVGDAGSMRVGIDYLLPYLLEQENWPHQQINVYRPSSRTLQLLRMASVRYAQPKYWAPTGQVEIRHKERNYAPLVCAALERQVSHDAP